ncbi:hypothetical protein TRVL_01324 [Trypanosoma vivax]|nr:hypothetical protein TRVL_01324 [Trypanosoma vivax]
MSSRKSTRHRSEFLDDDCGQSALQLAARGSTIIVEISRIAQYIPTEFVHPSETECAELISDFSYFKASDAFEDKIQQSAELRQKDEVFSNTHIELLDRCFKLFCGVYGYVMELNRFIEEIRDGMYVSHTIESILSNMDGKQLLCEIFHLYGVMLLLLDHKFPGKTREYLLVSYIRYKGASEPNMMEVTSLCRSTGFDLRKKTIPGRYPVSYFSRVPIDREVVGIIIGRIRSDDIYQMAYNFPAPEHRSAAMALQGAALYVLLFFRPEILLDEGPVMREIVDKHFADNWVINYYMGFTVDLSVAWRDFRAASLAISGTIAMDNVGYYLRRMRKSVTMLLHSIEEVLREGVLTEQYVLDNIYTTLLPLIREANVVLRWFILHANRLGPECSILEDYRAVYETVSQSVTEDDIIALLLLTAQLEYTLRSMFTNLLKQKRVKWEASREECVAMMSKLAAFFSGKHVLSDDLCDPQLEAWFTEISERIEGLEYANSTIASRKIQKLIKALENVKEFHQIDSNLQVVQFVQKTSFLLRQMTRYINIENKVLVTIATVGDVSYAWECMSTDGHYVGTIQMKIKKKPDLAVQMRAVFLKLASMLELPCNRIDQGAQNDARLLASLESTSEYYSGELVAFARNVLHVIPTSIFDLLRHVMDILTTELQECPTKLPRKEMRQQSQLHIRKRLSAYTADIAKYASGILAMESTLVGIIQVDPHQLLEDGIRKELVQQITCEMHQSLVFDRTKPPSAWDFNEELTRLSRRLNGIRASFEYIQDYVNVHGLRIWLEEFSRIVNFNVDMECNAFLQKQLYPWRSQYQSESIPIPYFRRKNGKSSYSFLGRIVEYLLAITNPVHSFFLRAHGSWYCRSTMEEVVGTRTFSCIGDAIGSMGLAALDRMLCFIVANDLQSVLKSINAALAPVEDNIMNLVASLCPFTSLPENAAAVYEKLIDAINKGDDPKNKRDRFTDVTKTLVHVGRVQLLRAMIANELRSLCKLNSGSLFASLCTANEALLAELLRHYDNPEVHPMPGDIIAAISPFLDNAGISDPLTKVYVTLKPIPAVVFYLIALTLCNVPRVFYNPRLASMVPSNQKSSVDPEPFVMGVALLLKQFHSDELVQFQNHLTQLIRVHVCRYGEIKTKTRGSDWGEVLPTEAETLAHMVHILSEVTGISTLDFHCALPATLCGDFRLSA